MIFFVCLNLQLYYTVTFIKSQGTYFKLFFYRGISMYRTHQIYELILKGIPQSLRGEIWLVFSGACNEVCFVFSCPLE